MDRHCDVCAISKSKCADWSCSVGWIVSEQHGMWPCSECLPTANKAWMNKDKNIWKEFYENHYGEYPIEQQT